MYIMLHFITYLTGACIHNAFSRCKLQVTEMDQH